MFRKSRRFVLVTTVVALAALVLAAVAYAVSSSISPETQFAHGGDTVSWFTTWSGTSHSMSPLAMGMAPRQPRCRAPR
jgi:hypothetical protein